MPIRVLIVDDHAVIREGLRKHLTAIPHVDVIGEASDKKTAISLAKELEPDVVTLDLGLPDGDGIEAISEIKAACPVTQILVITGKDDAEMLRHVLLAGGAGYIVKFVGFDEMCSAIRLVHEGRVVVCISQSDQLDQLFVNDNSLSFVDETRAANLSDRENEVLNSLALGYTNKQIAEKLYLSVKSVETYRSRLLKKLKLSDRSEVVQFALQNGLLTPSPVGAV